MPETPVNPPDGCTCTYLAWTRDADQTRRWERKLDWGCPANHEDIDRGLAVLVADSGPSAEIAEFGAYGRSTRLTAGLATHVAGPEVRVGPHFRQRCAWCGVILADAVTHGPAMWEPGDLVRSDGIAWRVTGHEDGADLPEDSCAVAEIDAAKGM